MDSKTPNSVYGNDSNNYETDLSCQQEMERLATGVSEMVLKSPTEKSSKLSADAPEFIPSGKWANNQPSAPQQPYVNSASAMENNSYEPPPANVQFSEAEISQYLLSDIRTYVAHLQNSPASFNEVAVVILDLLINYAYDEKLLAAAVNEIFRAGLEYENFSYQCARLCGYLAANYWGYGGASSPTSASDAPTASFRHYLLKRCREEHQARLGGPVLMLYNYGLLLADLYNQVKVEGRNVTILGDAVIAVVNVLLQHPNDGNVACAVRILKCCGSTLEVSERLDNGGGDQAATPKLDQLFAAFDHLLRSNQFGLSEDAKSLIKNLLTNRSDWRKYSAQAGDGFQQQATDDRVSSDMVYFGPDGEALTAEEAAFLEQELGAFQSSSSDEDNVLAAMVNPEDDALDDAYEEFLKMTEAKRKQQQQDRKH